MASRFLSFACVGTFLLDPAAASAAQRYVVDPTHTFALFEISHLGFSTLRGRFDKSSGDIRLDPTGKTGSAQIRIETASVSTGVKELDQQLRAAEVFDAARFPIITFFSDRFRFQGDRLVAVEGRLSMRGVSKPVTLQVEAFVCKQNPVLDVPVCGADATATIKRTDWGIKAFPPIADQVTLRLQVEAIADNASRATAAKGVRR